MKDDVRYDPLISITRKLNGVPNWGLKNDIITINRIKFSKHPYLLCEKVYVNNTIRMKACSFISYIWVHKIAF